MNSGFMKQLAGLIAAILIQSLIYFIKYTTKQESFDLFSLAVYLLVVGSAIGVFYDAWRAGIRKNISQSGILNFGPCGWGILVLFLWIIFLPIYLFRRNKMIEK